MKQIKLTKAQVEAILKEDKHTDYSKLDFIPKDVQEGKKEWNIAVDERIVAEDDIIFIKDIDAK